MRSQRQKGEREKGKDKQLKIALKRGIADGHEGLDRRPRSSPKGTKNISVSLVDRCDGPQHAIAILWFGCEERKKEGKKGKDGPRHKEG